ncbi:hypothetical protein O4H34_06885, partial [Shewanella colwelliana]|nr:hypothetical protein [Shewanella colwelliana]
LDFFIENLLVTDYEKILLMNTVVFRGDYPIIDRKSMPKAVSDKLIKSEFLVEKLDKIMNLKGKYLRLAYITDTRPFFNQEELESIGSFLIKQHIAPNTTADTAKATSQTATEQGSAPLASTPITAASTAPVQRIPAQAIAAESAPHTETEKSQTIQIVSRCKHCGESMNYTPMYGKFTLLKDRYIHCKECTKNTPMKQACPQCSSKNTRVQKRQETYTLNCQECGCGQRII